MRKGKYIIYILITLILLASSFTIGQYLYSKGVLEIFKTENKTNNNSTNTNTNTNKNDSKNSLAGKIFYSNLEGKEYIKFIDDTSYIRHYFQENGYYGSAPTENKGTYVYNGKDSITLNNKEILTLKNNQIIFPKEQIGIGLKSKLYFNSEIIMDEFSLLKDAIDESFNEPQSDIGGIEYAPYSRIDHNISECLYSYEMNKMICWTSTNIFFDPSLNYSSEKCDTIETNPFNAWTIGTGDCLSDHIEKFLGYSFEKKDNKYIISESFTWA